MSDAYSTQPDTPAAAPAADADDAPLTREEFIEKHGYDPETQLAASSYKPNYLKSLAVGAATIPTDLIALPYAGIAAGKALYSSYANDTKFLNEFAKNVQVEGAQKEIQDHLAEVAASWKQSNPDMSDEDIKTALENYQDSKQFEDYTHDRLSGGVYLATKTKDAVRKLLGDERPESQRSWTETGAEAIGGAIIPGPEGIAAKIGTTAARHAITNAIFNSAVGRGTLKVAEKFTPLTAPYTPANVAINATVGVGVDQALRYAQGQPTAFTPTNKDSASLGSLAATGLGIAGLATVVAVVKGRTKSLLQTADTATGRAIEHSPGLNYTVTDTPRAGEALAVSGDEQITKAPAALDEMNPAVATSRRAKNLVFDESAAPLQAVRDIHGPEEANHLEALRETGSVLNDTAQANADTAMAGFTREMDKLPPAQQRVAKTGILSSTLEAHNLDVERTLQSKIDEILRSKDPQSSTELPKLRDDLSRIRDDSDASARLAMPDTPRSHIQRTAAVYQRDPAFDALRAAHHEWADKMMDLYVSMGKSGKAYAAMLRAVNPDFMPVVNDPLKGATGATRMWRSVVQSFKSATTGDVEGTGSSITRESPVHELKKEVPRPRGPNDDETRVTAPLDPHSSMQRYTEAMYRDHAKTTARNAGIRALTQNSDDTESALVKNGNIKLLRDPNTGKEWHRVDQVGVPFVKDHIDKANIVPEYQNGHVRLWEVGDREYAAWLRQDPVRFNGMMKTLGVGSRWFKFFTTGRGNPVFALKGAAYDLVIGMLTRGVDRSLGPLSYLSHRVAPAWFNRNIIGRIPDPTALVAAPIHSMIAVSETLAHYGANYVAKRLEELEPFSAFRRTVGDRAYNAILKTSLKVATMTDHLATVEMMRKGAAKGVMSADNLTHVRDAHSMMRDSIPKSIRAAWQFYSHVLDSIYLGPKRMFYTENHALLRAKHGPNIPESELTKLMYETRTIGGDMNKIPSSKLMQDAEMLFPYLSQTKLGAYHLMRHMGSNETYSFMLPRLMLAMYAVGASYYWRTYWNEESSYDLWHRTPEYDRLRSFDVPNFKYLAAKWATGSNPNFSRDLFYRVTLPPDIAGVIAGTTAFMQATGMLPSSATPRPIYKDLPNIILDSLTPAMPPLAQLVLGASGMKLDPQSADTRGGSLIRSYNNTFRAGPQAESATNLGQVSTSTNLIMNSLFGAFGSHVVAGTDVMLHAAKFYPGVDAHGTPTLREQQDFGVGLKKALTEVYTRATANAPDVPLLWQNKERYKVATPAWQQVTYNNQYIKSIAGMRDHAMGKSSQQRRASAAEVGGIPETYLSDPLLLQIADTVKSFQNPSGELGKLRAQYSQLRNDNRSLTVQYNMTQEQRRVATNHQIKLMQDNMEQQHLAIKYFEQQIADKYGAALTPRLNGRTINMQSLDQIMRENSGSNQSDDAETATAAQQ